MLEFILSVEYVSNMAFFLSNVLRLNYCGLRGIARSSGLQDTDFCSFFYSEM